VSKWLSGKDQPSWRFVRIVSNTLDAPLEHAVTAAGFDPKMLKWDQEARLREAVDRLNAIAADAEVVSDLGRYRDSVLLAELERRARLREDESRGRPSFDVLNAGADLPARADVGGLDDDRASLEALETTGQVAPDDLDLAARRREKDQGLDDDAEGASS